MTGVGEASAIFGLITGSIDLIKLSIEICKAAKGQAPSRIQAVADQLPSIVTLLDDAHENGKTAPDNSVWSKVKPDLERCKKECTDLHTLFENACPKVDSNPAQRAWKTSVAIFKGKRSQAEEHLAAILKALSVLKTHHVITNTKLLEEVKASLGELEENEAGIVHNGTGDIKTVTGSGTYNEAYDNGRVIQTKHYNEHRHYHPNETAAAREQRTIESLLAWLNYAGMHQRREAVEEAHKDTFQWIFEGTRAPAWKVTSVWNWLSSWGNTPFVTWLREETGVFWIYGKPGAGKTTLMKYLVGDPRLEKHAKVWAGSDKLSVSSFYFWKQGSSIQKSLCGLYRALLWQICNDDQELTRKAFPGWQTSFGATEPGLGALREALNRLLKINVRGKKYLILIDGLDEYESDDPDARISQVRISEDLLHLVESASVKIIIASRPHRVFKSHFSHGPKLAVHSLTARDLELFAHDRLLNDQTIRPSGETLSESEYAQLRQLVLEIVRRSCGVFLWARILVDLARVHIRDYHDLDQLKEILAKLHPDIEELFDQIMDMILKLRGPEKIEGLRYMALVSHWFATSAGSYQRYSNWLPISILSVGCELSIEKVTEPWLQENTQRLKAIGHHELRAEGRIESYCFGLLEVSTIEEGSDGAFEPNPTRKVIKPLHRTLMEYLSRHYAIQSAQELSLPGHEPYDTNTAVLLGLVVMEDRIYPLVPLLDSDSSLTPGLINNVLIFNKLSEESTGVAQIALLSAFDRTMKAGFEAIVKKHCHLDHDHKVRCVFPRPYPMHMPDYDRNYVAMFYQLILQFALNRSHPLISRESNPGGFLDLLAITIACDSNGLLMRWISTTISQSRAIVSAEAARLLDHALNKRENYVVEIVPEPNLGALQSLLQIEASPDIRLDGVSAWERFLDQMLSQSMKNAGDSGEYQRRHLSDLKALDILRSYGVRKDVYRTWPVLLEKPGEWSNLGRMVSPRPFKRCVIEFRRYSVVHIVSQTASMLHRQCSAAQPTDCPHQHRIDLEDCFSKLEKLRHHLEEQNANTVPGPRCSWSDLRRAAKDRVSLERSRNAKSKLSEALATARRTGCDIAEYQQIRVRAPLPSDEGSVATWLPHGCRETHELPKDLVPSADQQWLDRLTLEEGEQQAGFDVVGWLVFKEDDHYYEADSSSSESSSDDLPA